MGIGSVVGGIASGLGGLLGAQGQRGAAGQAGLLQMMLGQQAIAAQQAMFGEAKGALTPYMRGGSEAMDFLLSLLHGGAQGIGGGGPSLMSTFAPTMEQLRNTPGYQWALDQGLRAVQNSAAGRGLGFSGNALQGGVQFAEGLASTTYQQQLDNFLRQNQQAYNMLLGPSQLGANAAGTLAQAAGQTGANVANTITGMGQAGGASLMGQANAQAAGYNALASGASTLGYGMPNATLGSAYSGLGNVLLGGPSAIAPVVNAGNFFGQNAPAVLGSGY